MKATIFAGLAVALVFAIASLWQFIICDATVCKFIELYRPQSQAEHWYVITIATLAAAGTVLALFPFAMRTINERNRALEEVKRQSAALQESLGKELKQQNERFNLALENLCQGICMFDGEQRLIISNKRYAIMYDLPPELIQPGVTLRRILEHRIANGFFAEGSPEAYIEERMAWVSSGKQSKKTQQLTDGRCIEIIHQPMSDGGWLTTHEDITERKKSSDLLRAIIDSFPGGIAAYDANLVLRMANKNYHGILDIPADEFPVGTHVEKIAHYNAENERYGTGDPLEIARARVADLARFERYSIDRLRPDGTCLEIQGYPLPEGTGFVSTCVDITERKTAEALNLRLARIIEDSINEVYVYDAETLKFLQVNAAACNNLGYSEEELKELALFDIKSSLTLPGFENRVAPLKRGETEHLRFESSHRRRDGSVYDADVVLQQINSEGKPVFASIIEDITDRKRVEEALQQSEELFSKAFQKNAIPLSVSRPDGAIYDVNEAWLTTMGYTRDEAIGNSALKLQIWADPNHRAAFVAQVNQDKIVTEYAAQFQTKSGKLLDMLISGEVVDVGGKPHMFILAHDVTKSNKAKQELLEHRDHLQMLVNEATGRLKSKAERLEIALQKEKDLNELQRQFVSTASHEFRTPLAVIDGLVQRLIRKKDQITPEDLEERAIKIRRAVQTITNLMESTLSAARMDAGQARVNIAKCDLIAVITEVCEQQRQIGGHHNFICDLTGLPKSIDADAAALNQVFTNLLSNAAKYSPKGSDITVKGWLDGANVMVSVQDNGLGIDEKDLPKMFTRFFRAKTSTGIPGTGIGLNLVQTLVELHGGLIAVESTEEGIGSTFTICLPVCAPASNETRTTRAA